jgi:hypothetical protein
VISRLGLIPRAPHEGHYGMLPIRERVLHLADIAEYWTRELHRVRAQPEIYAELLSAFWQDQLAVVHVHNLHPIDRRSVLKGINSTRKSIPEHPGFTLIDRAEMIPPRVEKHPDGRWTVDRRLYIVLPSNYADWTDEIVNAAYDQLAKIPLDDFHELLRPPIVGLGATKEAFAAYCDLMGWDRPRFWFAKERSRTWAARRQRDLEAWLRQFASGPKRKTKDTYFAEAIKQFPGVSHLQSDLEPGGPPKLEAPRARSSPTTCTKTPVSR